MVGQAKQIVPEQNPHLSLPGLTWRALYFNLTKWESDELQNGIWRNGDLMRCQFDELAMNRKWPKMDESVMG